MEKTLQKLKNWRDKEAARMGRPSYYVLSNNNLYQVVQNNPQNEEELKNLPGWGDRKVAKYGDKILKMMHDQEENSYERNFSSSEKNLADTNKSGEVFEEGQKNNVISVSEYVNLINFTVSQFGIIKVKGEINDLSGTQRGLAFFDLKDTQRDNCVMQCVVFRRNFEYLKHMLEEGMEVVVYGKPSMYEPNGSFRFVVDKIEPVGEGAYKKAPERLRKKLQEKGYFSPERKSIVPDEIRNIGLITSKNGAAIDDFRKNLEEFGFQVFLKNVFVEGASAEASIIEAIKLFNRLNFKLDVLVLIRGGGSWESLRAFNEEKVVEAVVESRLPIITGIGHQKDETLTGMASDVDCSTPSMVASFLSEKRRNILNKIMELKEALLRKKEDSLKNKHNDLLKINRELTAKVENIFYKMDILKNNFKEKLSSRLLEMENRIDKINIFKKAFSDLIKSQIERKETFVDNFSKSLQLLNPKKILARGYSIVYNKKGEIIRKTEDIAKEQEIKTEVSDGFFDSVIKKIYKKE
jgi:exodeoxyribonuclease VII large subunit